MSVFSGLLDRRIAVVEMPIGDQPIEIMEAEEAAVADAVPRRRREYAAGRACARKAFAALGAPPAALPAGPDRLPRWPAGYVGSITHDDRLAAAAVARVADGVRSVGIDLEPAEPLPSDLRETICRPEELAWLDARPAAERAVMARAIFGAKECAFKCQYPLTRRMLEFHDVAVSLDPGRETFAASFLCDEVAAVCGRTMQGRLRATRAFLACAVVLDAGAPG